MKKYLFTKDLEVIRKFWDIKEVTCSFRWLYWNKFTPFFEIKSCWVSGAELWNSIIFEIPEAKEYIEFRINFGTTKIKTKEERFIKQSSQVHNLNKISGPWWVVELTRNGKIINLQKMHFFVQLILLIGT